MFKSKVALLSIGCCVANNNHRLPAIPSPKVDCLNALRVGRFVSGFKYPNNGIIYVDLNNSLKSVIFSIE